MLGLFVLWADCKPSFTKTPSSSNKVYVDEGAYYTDLSWEYNIDGESVTWVNFKHKSSVGNDFLACEQAPGGASAEQTFGAKRRAIGACTHSPKSPLPPTRR